eukprot:g9088.t1
MSLHKTQSNSWKRITKLIHIHTTGKRYYIPTTSTSVETIDIVVPALGDSINEGTLVEWSKDVDDGIQADDVLAIIETDKVSVDVRSPTNGVLKELLVSVDENVSVGNLLCRVVPGDFENETPIENETPKIITESVEQKENEKTTQCVNKGYGESAVELTHQSTRKREENRVKMSRMRQRISQRLKDSQNTAAMLTTFNEVDMSSAMSIRADFKDLFEKEHGVRLGFMSFFAKASAEALVSTPSVNAYIDDETNEIVYRNYVDISVAVASPRGLVVPVLRNVESMTFAAIETAISDYGRKAQNDEITMEDMTGGTFTISNGGVFGSMMGTPIINPPQSAILGMHGIKQRAVVVDNEIVIRPMMYLALTYDHRLVDGREAVTFLKSICDNVENPTRLLLGI